MGASRRAMGSAAACCWPGSRYVRFPPKSARAASKEIGVGVDALNEVLESGIGQNQFVLDRVRSWVDPAFQQAPQP